MNCGKRGRPPGLVVNCAYAQAAIDDLLHELGQPLTTLRCSLDLALRRKTTEQQLREALNQAANLTDRLLKIASSQRQLLEAGSGGKTVRMDLSEAVRAISADFEPVLESCGRTMMVAPGEPAMICADRERISRALFAAIDLALYRVGDQKRLLLATYRCGGDAACYIGEDSAPLPGTISSMELRAFEPSGASEIVARMVGAAGGSAWEVFLHNYSAFVFSFPLAHAAGKSVSDGTDQTFNILRKL